MKNEGKPFQVKTGKPIKENAIPRQPHERDESPDSQVSETREVIEQAYDDVVSGQVNTDLREAPGVEATVDTGKSADEASKETAEKSPAKKYDRS